MGVFRLMINLIGLSTGFLVLYGMTQLWRLWLEPLGF